MYSKKQNQIRVRGQRSIDSLLVFRSSNTLARVSNQEEQNKDSSKESSISLSDFLDSKLHRNSVLPKIVKGKSRPFLSPLGPRDCVESADDSQIGTKKKEEERLKPVVDELVFEQFKHNNSKEKGNVVGSSGDGENTTISTSFGVDDVETSPSLFDRQGARKRRNPFAVMETSPSLFDRQGARKRRNPFAGVDENIPARKHSLVLGVDPAPKRRDRGETSNGDRKRRPLYNHYANGGGWWDCDMEGVDTDEVGSSEIWEGIGSTTTFGGM